LGKLFEKREEVGLRITGKKGVGFARSRFLDISIASKKVLDEAQVHFQNSKKIIIKLADGIIKFYYPLQYFY
jgi:hypothetical protein